MMTNKRLKFLIEKLNRKNTAGLIFLTPLSNLVDLGTVWAVRPKATDNIPSNGPYKLYFIKNKESIYVAAVLDMEIDLHWLVLPKYRHQGHLPKALKETIIPHLFEDRSEQRITINQDIIGIKNAIASEKVALGLGFLQTQKSDFPKEYILSENKFDHNAFNLKNISISEERMKELKKQINYISRSLWLVQSEVEMCIGKTGYSEELKELSQEIQNHIYRFEDAWWESKSQVEGNPQYQTEQ